MARNENGYCPRCDVDFDGGSIWKTGYDFAVLGKHYEQKGVPATSEDEAEELADKYAKAYGATRTTGQWGRQIGIYDMGRDRTVAWRCPDCGHEWGRG